MPRGSYRPLCSVNSCGRPHVAQGFCAYHYQRDRRGVPLDHPYHKNITWRGRPVEHISGADKAKRNRMKKQGAMIWYKMLHPCADCDCGDPRVLEFDHVRGDKAFNLQSAKTKPLIKILEEILKCDVVCANCHRLRTQKRMNGNGETTTYVALGLKVL